MREILFKAKRIDNGEWIEGNLVLSNDAEEDFRAIIIPQTDSNMFTNHEGFKEVSCDLGFENWCKVDINTICQFTGLIDKNGERIWENDVIRCGRKTFVTWDVHFASWCLTRKGWLYKHFFGESQEPEDCEVIGNIFDNPELLKE